MKKKISIYHIVWCCYPSDYGDYLYLSDCVDVFWFDEG